jgi:hypothetical protein
MKREEKIKAVKEAVMRYFVETGRWASIAEIASVGGLSEGQVRSVIHECYLSSQKDSAPKMSRDYPGMQYGIKVFWVYAPTRDAMRREIARLSQ